MLEPTQLNSIYCRAYEKSIVATTKVLENHSENFHGFYLVNFFHSEKALNCVKTLNMPYKIILADKENFNKDNNEYIFIKSDYTSLPFGENSIDSLLVVNTHELIGDQLTNFLRDCARVIRPNGKFIISGINLFSYLGLKITVKSFISKSDIRLYTPQNVIKWLELLSFETEEMFLYNLKSNESIGITNPLYTIVSKKIVNTLTPIKPRWSYKEMLIDNKLTNTNNTTKGEI
jgi:SAM-dependent methyltransferase